MKNTTESISRVISENIRDPRALFVFSTDVIRSTWVDRALRAASEHDVAAVSLDNFTTWDRFKAEYFEENAGDLVCVPAVMRRVFAEDLLARNNDEHFLRLIVNSDEEHRDAAPGFTDWIAKILPSLKMWHDRMARTTRESDDEDKDYMTLYERYTAFLSENGFFEPAYLDESLSSRAARRKIFIFYPEIIEDFSDFEDAFAAADNITLVRFDAEAASRPACDAFDDARGELRFLALRLRRLQAEGRDLRRVSVSVPDLDTVRPYLERELSRYAVPYVVRAGEPYTKAGGSIFVKIRECISQNFSFDSVRALVLDGSVPWRDSALNERLVREGSERRCVCSYKESGRDVDPWEESLPEEGGIKAHYLRLRKDVERFGDAKSFAALRTAWNAFRKNELDEEGFADPRYELTNNVLGRIVSMLGSLVEVEREHIAPRGMTLSSHFGFFINELRRAEYTPAADKYGVNIFPYSVASYADFDYNFVINASQDSLSLPYKRLAFITDAEKRKALGLDEGAADAATVTAALYAKEAREGDAKQCFFSFSKKSFSGASIMHTALEEKTMSVDARSDLETYDILKSEREAFLDGVDGEREISAAQKRAFDAWRERASEGDASELSDALKERARFTLRHGTDTVKVSQTELKYFFPCPRKFLLRNVIGLSEDTLDTSLTKSYEAGDLMHKIIELVFDKFKENGDGCVPVWEEQSADDVKRIEGIVDTSFDEAAGHIKLSHSLLALTAMKSQKTLFCEGIVKFLSRFCRKGSDGKSFGGYRIVSLECERKSPSAAGSFDFFGRVDCVLSGEDGSLTIVDYKSGGLPEAKACIYNGENTPPLSDFQMATYVKLLEDGGRRVGTAVFYSVRQNSKGAFDVHAVIQPSPKGNSAAVKREDFDTTEDKLEEYGALFAEKCAHFDFEPRRSRENKELCVDAYNNCTKCAFGAVCRTAFNVAKQELKK